MVIFIVKIGSRIARKDTPFSDAISVKERLAMTLRFLASEDSYKSLCYLLEIFRVANQECMRNVANTNSKLWRKPLERKKCQYYWR